jgi:hypothetical protein
VIALFEAINISDNEFLCFEIEVLDEFGVGLFHDFLFEITIVALQNVRFESHFMNGDALICCLRHFVFGYELH